METSSVATLAFMGMGPTELIVILVILLVLFGGAKLPGLAKGIGQSIKEFKKASKDEPESPPAPKVVEEAKKTEPASRPGTS
ncbi:MAG: twin-arginine translocase TatA/TatE family subunit [Opitutaceae bacterium]|nr:twin-arginine translocase TatA/TatE family subunit [Opitutaceae bacterium]